MNTKKPRISLKLILFALTYMFFTAIMFAVNVFKLSLHTPNNTLNASDISMLITMIISIITVLSVMTLKKPAYRTAVVLFIVHALFVAAGIIVTRDMTSLVGAVTILFMFIITTAIYRHISAIESKDTELRKIAYTDPLTNTPNRRAFNDLINSLISSDYSNKTEFALVYIDINEFTQINDAAGHEYGDKLLNEVVTRLKYAMKNDDFIARTGGDEFALIIKGFKDENELTEHINLFVNALKNKVTIDDQSVFVSASMGVAIYPKDSTNADELLRYADIAMQEAQSRSDSNICMFDRNMIDKVENDLNIENLMRDAIHNDLFKLVFQPQYDTNTKKLRGFETLLRMTDTGGKPISPGIFIPMAEKNGLITDIDCYVLKKAMATFLPMLKKYNDKLILSVNISAIHLTKNSFVSDVESALIETGFPASNLEIEITESVFISSLESTAKTLDEIKAMGVKIALDDFGTGYASLSYLTKLPIDLLKIDKSFVDGLHEENNFADFVAAIISMGHLLHFDVISEGVEYETQLDMLKQLNCDFIQGFLWGRPMDIEAVDTLLKLSG